MKGELQVECKQNSVKWKDFWIMLLECKRFTQLFQWILKKWKILPYEIWSWYRKSCSCSLDAWRSRDECTCGLNGPWPSLPAADLEKVAPWHHLWRFPSAAEKWSEIPWIFPHEFHEFRRDICSVTSVAILLVKPTCMSKCWMSSLKTVAMWAKTFFLHL